VNIYSIPHTGTHFVQRLLGVKAKHVEGWKKTDELIILPIRDPWTTYVTWVSRGRDQDFKEKWFLLNEIYETQDTLVLPIDTKDREMQLSKISARIGKDLETDWKPINNGPRKEVEYIDLSDVYKLPVVDRFYGSKTKAIA
jgi:hypothetical protein|tara:strand:- start:864 stop:1286 length:423 start_codon:yes stop_codon:yes gene_type:complete